MELYFFLRIDEFQECGVLAVVLMRMVKEMGMEMEVKGRMGIIIITFIVIVERIKST